MELIILLFTEGYLSVEDMIKRKVSLWKLLLYIPISLYFLFSHEADMLYSSFFGFMIGLFFIMVSLITSGKLGIADAIVILFIGIICGYETQLKIVFYSFFFSFGVAILFILRKRGKKTTIPFIPCIFLGNLFAVVERSLL